MRPLDPFSIPLSGAHLIEANAGTGKTYTITTLAVRLLLERRLEIGQLLVVTYTNAATAELRRTVRQRLKDVFAALRGTGDPQDATMAALSPAPPAVLPACRREGIGSALVRRGLELCRERGHRIVALGPRPVP